MLFDKVQFLLLSSTRPTLQKESTVDACPFLRLTVTVILPLSAGSHLITEWYKRHLLVHVGCLFLGDKILELVSSCLAWRIWGEKMSSRFPAIYVVPQEWRAGGRSIKAKISETHTFWTNSALENLSNHEEKDCTSIVQ